VSTSSKQAIILATEEQDMEIWLNLIEQEAEGSTDNLKGNFKGWLYVDPSGKNKKWEQKYFILSGTVLNYYDNPKAVFSPIHSFDLVGKVISRADDKSGVQFSFRITSADDEFIIKAKEDDEADCWVELLKEVSRSGSTSLSEKKGWLTKQGGSIKTWKKRWCELRDTQLYYFKNPGDMEEKGHIELKGKIIRHLSSAEAREMDLKSVIRISVPSAKDSRTYHLYADSQQEIIDWSIALRKASLHFTGRTIFVDGTATSKNKKELRFPTIQEAVCFVYSNLFLIDYTSLFINKCCM